MAWRYRARRVPRRRCRRRRRRRRSWQRDQEEEEEEEDLGSARGVAIPRARTKYLTLTIGETRCSLYTRLTSRLENIAASCYLHSPIEPATARGMRVIVSRLPLSALLLSFLSLSSSLSLVPPSLTGLLPVSSVFSRSLEHDDRLRPRDSGWAMDFLERGRLEASVSKGLAGSRKGSRNKIRESLSVYCLALIKLVVYLKRHEFLGIPVKWKSSIRISRLCISTIIGAIIKNVSKSMEGGRQRIVSSSLNFYSNETRPWTNFTSSFIFPPRLYPEESCYRSWIGYNKIEAISFNEPGNVRQTVSRLERGRKREGRSNTF